MCAVQAAGGPGVPASALGCPAAHAGQGSPGWGRWGAGKETQALGHLAVSPRVPSTLRQAGQAGGGAGGSGGNCPGWGHPEGEPAWLQEGVGTLVRTGLSVGHEAEAGEKGQSSRGADRPSEGRSHVLSAPGEKHCRQAGGTGMPSQGWLESPSPSQSPDPDPGPSGAPRPPRGRAGVTSPPRPQHWTRPLSPQPAGTFRG